MKKLGVINFDPKEERTKQSHKKECDINTIMEKFQSTGVIQHVRHHEAQYMDIGPNDFRAAMEVIATASSMFEELPSKARARFQNSPEKFLEFVQDPENHKNLYELGLATAPYKTPNEETPNGDRGAKGEPFEDGSKATSNGEESTDAAL